MCKDEICYNTLFLSLPQKLRKLTSSFINILSDRTEEPDELAFDGFGELLIDDPKAGIPFYCVMQVPSLGNTVKWEWQKVNYTADELDKWLHNVDELAAKNYQDCKFVGFVGNTWLSGDGEKGFVITAVFDKRPRPY